MPITSFQIRICQNPDCGLRYPFVENPSFGDRCPACLGQTKLVSEQLLFPNGEPVNSPFSPGFQISALLDNLRSGLNVGSIFRSAEGYGFQHIYLCGITPSPENPEVRKSAVEAEQFIKWTAHKNALELIISLKDKGYDIWALEKTVNAVPISLAKTAQGKTHPLLLVVGNEVTGIDPGILETADRLVYLPMQGQKRSFNVAVAFAIAAHILCSEI